MPGAGAGRLNPAVAGTWYPSDPVELRELVRGLLHRQPVSPGFRIESGNVAMGSHRLDTTFSPRVIRTGSITQPVQQSGDFRILADLYQFNN